MSRDSKRYKIFEGASSTTNSGLDTVSGEAYGVFATDFRNAIITVSTSGSADFTLIVKGAIMNQVKRVEDIDFASASSITNPWDKIQVVDLQDGIPIDGDTGIVYAGADEVRSFEVNINALDLVQFEISVYSAGAINVDLVLTEN